MPSKAKGELVMPICIAAAKLKVRLLPAEIEFSVLVGYYRKAVFSRKIKTLSTLGYTTLSIRWLPSSCFDSLHHPFRSIPTALLPKAK